MRLRILPLLMLAVACDEAPADKPAASASVQAATALPSAVPTPEPKKEEPPPVVKRECKAGNVVDFADADVEAEVRRKLQKEKGDITKAELGKIKSLKLSSSSLNSLDNCIFPHLTHVQGLFFGRGKIRDIEPLAELTTLLDLKLAFNPITDIAKLEKLTKLDRLDLGHTQIRDLKPLEKLTEITDLQLDDTPVDDLTPLAKLTKLEKLSIQRTRVKDLKPLKELKSLKFVYINGAPVDEPFVIMRPGLKVVDQ
ncbi:MAG: leucine-rich repeat domain-containing protein [Polyangiaceae bacterium]|nr:leucine-rich repeat domain-containing protein [Myxococcales bacterium]MCB9587754.1 leucine-rich repeat domain-containing protein [Polyangiaceae bacterium]